MKSLINFESAINYVNMRDNYDNFRLICANMRHDYVNMQHFYAACSLSMVDNGEGGDND